MTRALIFPGVISKTNSDIKIVNVGQAEKILGSERVCSAKDVSRAWEKEKRSIAYQIPYSSQTLEACAADNAAKKADWRLTFYLGLSYGNMYTIRGEYESKQPCFHPEPSIKQDKGTLCQATHLLNESMQEDNIWLAKESEPSYVLTDFTPRFKGLSWDEQERCISAMGKCVRTHDKVFTETVMSIFMVKDIRLAVDWFHWGITKHCGYHLCVGRFIPWGLIVREGWAGAGLSVVMDRIPDHLAKCIK